MASAFAVSFVFLVASWSGGLALALSLLVGLLLCVVLLLACFGALLWLPSPPAPFPLAFGGQWFRDPPRLSPFGYLVASATVWACGRSVLPLVCYWLVWRWSLPFSLRQHAVWQQRLRPCVGHGPLHHAGRLWSLASPSESASRGHDTTPCAIVQCASPSSGTVLITLSVPLYLSWALLPFLV